jgi:hypothetical protein
VANRKRRAFGPQTASCDLVFQSTDGAKRPVRVRVGKPYRESPLIWRCPAEIRGFEGRYADLAGVDSMQALCLALALVRFRIEDFIDRGGKVLHTEDGSEWNRQALMAIFGASPWKKGRIVRR